MSKQNRRHEQLLFHYSSALERGDFQAVADVLREAERDPELEEMILQMNDTYTAERFNHTNPKESPMIAAIYQNPLQTQLPARAQARRFQWYSLPLVGALAVIAMLSIMLAVQMRRNNPGNTGQINAGSALEQVTALCTATTRSIVNVVSLPGTAGVILGSIPSDAVITVWEQKSFFDYQGNLTAWYFVTHEATQGWITTESLDTRNCPEVTPPPGLVPPVLVPESPDQLIPATAIAPSDVTVACRATTHTTVDVFSTPSWNGIITGSIPRNTLVTVGDYNIFVDAQRNRILWYFVTTDSVRGWVLASLLDVSACPPILDASSVSVVTATASPPTVVSPANLQPFTSTPLPLVATVALSNSADAQGISIAATNLARLGEGGVCKATTLTTAAVLSRPEPEGVILTTLPGNTIVAVGDYITSIDSQGNPAIWYIVGVGDAQGWMQASLLDASACPADESIQLSATQRAEAELYMSATASVQAATASAAVVQPTLVPGDAITVTAAPMIIPPFVATDGEGKVIYIVQPGDTLLSILMRLGLDASILPDLLRLNDLTSGDMPGPGTLLRIPWTLDATVTICRVNPAQTLEVRANASGDAPLIATFGGGTEFQVVNLVGQPEANLWLMINAQLDGVTIQNAWVESRVLDFITDCGLVLPITADTTAPPLVLTATPFPVTAPPQPTPTLVR